MLSVSSSFMPSDSNMHYYVKCDISPCCFSVMTSPAHVFHIYTSCIENILLFRLAIQPLLKNTTPWSGRSYELVTLTTRPLRLQNRKMPKPAIQKEFLIVFRIPRPKGFFDLILHQGSYSFDLLKFRGLFMTFHSFP